MLGGVSPQTRVMTVEQADGWYERVSHSPLSWVREAQTHCIGNARSTAHTIGDCRSRYAIGIFDHHSWGQGHSIEATRLIFRYAFEELSLPRVSLRVLAFNEQGIACYERCGFVREGGERAVVQIQGIWYGDVMMAVLEGE